MRVFDLEARLGLDSQQFQAGMNRAQRTAQRVRGGLVTLGRAGLAVGAGLGAAGGAALAAGKRLGNYADSILDAEQQTGLTVQTLQEFRAVSREAGVPVGALAGSAERLTTRLGSAANMSAETKRAFEQLGVTVHNADGSVRDMNELMPEILGSLGDMENITDRNALAADIFGRSFGEIAPVLALGTERIDELTDAAQENGDVMSREQLEAANQLRIGMENVQAALSNLGREFLIELLPVMQQVVSWVEGNIPAMRDYLREVFTRLAEAWDEYGKPTLEAVRPLLENVIIPIVRTLATNVLPLVTGAIQTIANILSGNFSEAWESFRALLGTAGTMMLEVVEAIVGPIEELPQRFLEIGGDIMAGLRDGITAGLESVRTAVGDAATGVADRFRNLLGIQSPSTVFQEYGRNILEGLTLGLTDPQQIAAIREAVEAAVAVATNAAETAALGEEVADRVAAREALAADDASRTAASASTSARFSAGRFAGGRRARGDGGLADLVAAQFYGDLADAFTARASRGDGGLEEALDRASIIESAQAYGAARGAAAATAADDAMRNASSAFTSRTFGLADIAGGRRARGDGGLSTLTRGDQVIGRRARGDGGLDRLRAAQFVESRSRRARGSGMGSEQDQVMAKLANAGRAAAGALGQFGESALGAAREAVPALDAAITGFAQGGPLGALTAVFTSLLGESEVFQSILASVNAIFEPLVGAFDTLLTALKPIIDVALALVDGALQPLVAILENIVAPVFEFVARIVAGIWNAIARAINAVLGWAGVNLRTIDLDEGLGPDEEPDAIPRPDGIQPSQSPVDPEEAAERREQSFGRVSQGIQLAVATPLVEASALMQEAATRISSTFAPDGGGAFAQFAGVLDRLTPVLERILREGVDVQASAVVSAPTGNRTGALRGV